MSTQAPPHVVVLGGGSAGWITACLLHHQWAARGGRVTVIESPDIGIIGVGEGSTPQLKAMFDHLGITEDSWMPACDATFKLGIRFTGWSARPGFESYFHPFPGPVDLHSQPAFFRNATLARRGFDVPAHPDHWYLATRLAREGKGPHPAPHFPFAPSYGYHFDAYRLGAFLRDWATARGVVHIEAEVSGVERDVSGDVAALCLTDGRRITGDLFVDCSGFRALIAGEALGGTFLSYADGLFADRAVVMPSAQAPSWLPQTEAVAMRAGWRWHIPLTSRVGNGYVYSSRHIDDDAAEAELRAAIGMTDSDVAARRLTMKVGRRAESWTRNCLAAGLAQGFVEPLEATALHIVIATVLDFADMFEAAGFTPAHREDFNAAVAARYDNIRDYIVAHYRMNQRDDTSFWRDNATNQRLSGPLKAMISAWFSHHPIEQAVRAIYPDPAYDAISWTCLFAGYGSFPAPDLVRPLPHGASGADHAAIAAMLTACAANFTAPG